MLLIGNNDEIMQNAVETFRQVGQYPANIYLFKVKFLLKINRNTIKWCEICLKLTIKTQEPLH